MYVSLVIDCDTNGMRLGGSKLGPMTPGKYVWVTISSYFLTNSGHT